MSRPARGAWIEIPRSNRARTMCARSRPARGAWIEIIVTLDVASAEWVAPRKGRVD